jgi:aminoglycoside phosphotransferase (APT) family kinase protein
VKDTHQTAAPARLGSPIARGRTAEIYPWDDGHVLKLFCNWCPRAWADHEEHLSHIVQDAGLPVPAVGEIVEINGRRGVVFERVDGPSLLNTVERRPWTIRSAARLLADLHAAMHAQTAPDLPSCKQGLAGTISAAKGLPDDLKQATLNRLASLPDGDALCHCDFHMDNIVMTARGPVIIDWMTAARGHPLADVARSLLLATIGAPASGGPPRWLLDILRSQYRAAYLTRYFALSGADRSQLANWQPIVAAARINENIPGEQAWLLASIRKAMDT